MKKFLKKTEGFTLVELIVVIAILGILAAIAVPIYSGYVTKADEAADIQTLSAVNTALAAAMTENDLPMADAEDYLTFTPTAGSDGGCTIAVAADKDLEEPEATTAAAILADFNTYYGGLEIAFDYYEDVDFATDGNLIGEEP